MKQRALPLVAVVLAALGLAVTGLAALRTTAPGAYLTVRVTLTDKGVSMSPRTAPRGTVAIFLISNRSGAPHSLLVGDVARGPGKKIGFLVKLEPNGQKRIVMFLDYRGPLPYGSADLGKTRLQGTFRVT